MCKDRGMQNRYSRFRFPPPPVYGQKGDELLEQIPWSERNRNLLHRKTDDPANKPTTEKSIAMQGGIPLPKAKAWNRGERAPVTQASACASRLIHALSRRCSRRL